MVFLQAKVKSGDLIDEGTVAAQIGRSNLAEKQRTCLQTVLHHSKCSLNSKRWWWWWWSAVTSEQAKCLKLVNQSTRALQWSKAWISSCVTTRFMWACWWMLFWHKTICNTNTRLTNTVTSRHVTWRVDVRVFNSPETWQHQTLHWPSHHNPRRRNVCLYKVHWEEITYTRDVTLTRAQMCSCVVMVILPAGVFHGPQQKFSVRTWEHTERMNENEKRSDLSCTCSTHCNDITHAQSWAL